jgi:hypothetical protein
MGLEMEMDNNQLLYIFVLVIHINGSLYKKGPLPLLYCIDPEATIVD